jgi:hypothetical protein
MNLPPFQPSAIKIITATGLRLRILMQLANETACQASCKEDTACQQ